MIAVPALYEDSDDEGESPELARSSTLSGSLGTPFMKSTLRRACISPVEADGADATDSKPAAASATTTATATAEESNGEASTNDSHQDGAESQTASTSNPPQESQPEITDEKEQPPHSPTPSTASDTSSKVRVRSRNQLCSSTDGQSNLEIWCGHDNGRVAVLDAVTLRQKHELSITGATRRNHHMAHLVVSNLSCSTVSRVSRLQDSRRVNLKLGSQEPGSPSTARAASPGSPSLSRSDQGGLASRLRTASVSDPMHMRNIAARAKASKDANRCVSMVNNTVMGTEAMLPRRSPSGSPSPRTRTPVTAEDAGEQGRFSWHVSSLYCCTCLCVTDVLSW